MCLPVLVGGAGGVEPRHQGQVEMLQIEWQRLPHSSVGFSATPPLTLDLHGDWTLTGRQDPQSVALAQVGKAPPTYLRQARRGREGASPEEFISPDKRCQKAVESCLEVQRS